MLPPITTRQKLCYQAQSRTFADVLDGVKTLSRIAKQTTDSMLLNFNPEPTIALRMVFPSIFEKIGYVFLTNHAKAVPQQLIANVSR